MKDQAHINKAIEKVLENNQQKINLLNKVHKLEVENMKLFLNHIGTEYLEANSMYFNSDNSAFQLIKNLEQVNQFYSKLIKPLKIDGK